MPKLHLCAEMNAFFDLPAAVESHAKGEGLQQYHWEKLLTNKRFGSDSSEIMSMIGLYYNINTAQKVASRQTRLTITYFEGWCPVTEHHDTAKGLLTKGIKLPVLSSVRTLLSGCTCDFVVCRLLCAMCLNNKVILFSPSSNKRVGVIRTCHIPSLLHLWIIALITVYWSLPMAL